MAGIEDTDVLIVGAGPTGLMLANQLARRRVRVILMERNSGPALQTRALGVQARTLEIYARLGIAARALELGKRATGAQFWVNGSQAARVPLGDMGWDQSPFPFILILGQDDNEKLLGERLAHWGARTEWNRELVSLEQLPDHVVAEVRETSGEMSQVRARWVAGCDGAHSTVRNLCGIDFPGAPYEHVFFVADTTVTGPMRPDELNVYLWRDGFHLFFPMRGRDHWRIVGILPAALQGREDVQLQDVVPSIRENAGTALEFQDCRWFATYRIHHRRAAAFRDRRCFLLGDAAHIHSPVGAQGMNTGLQDAYNLGWKLALVAHDGAAESLLDTYELERIPVAEKLLRTTDQVFSVVVSDRRLSALFRTQVQTRLLALAMKFSRVRALAFRVVSQIGIHYRGSPLSPGQRGWPKGAPQPGDRFPWLRLRFAAGSADEDLYERLDDGQFNLVLYGQQAGSGAQFGQLVRVHEIPRNEDNRRELERRGIPAESWFLLRPDGYIATAGTRLDEAAVRRWFADAGITAA